MIVVSAKQKELLNLLVKSSSIKSDREREKVFLLLKHQNLQLENIVRLQRYYRTWKTYLLIICVLNAKAGNCKQKLRKLKV